jgi:hypothetical protein
MRSIWFSEPTAIISMNSSNTLVFITHCALCEVRPTVVCSNRLVFITHCALCEVRPTVVCSNRTPQYEISLNTFYVRVLSTCYIPQYRQARQSFFGNFSLRTPKNETWRTNTIRTCAVLELSTSPFATQHHVSPHTLTLCTRVQGRWLDSTELYRNMNAVHDTCSGPSITRFKVSVRKESIL